jgi:oxygen-independent coproporphyrinogen III oxidase
MPANNSPFGLYIHIPYCRKACTYCDFYFSTNPTSMPAFVAALQHEMKCYHIQWPGEIRTIYFGGGTPSQMADHDLAGILAHVRSLWVIAPDVEITLEANPEDISAQRLANWLEMGINRLSIGIQSFDDQVLQWMNRTHTSKQAIAAVQEAKQAGFVNISVDFIYWVPAIGILPWEENVAAFIDLAVPHCAAYALTVEPKTHLQFLVNQNKVVLPSEEDFTYQFDYLSDAMEGAGFEHYELSNFAKPGWRSRHNTSYWQGIPYLGLGPSAHSFNGESRCSNVANIWQYVDCLAAGLAPVAAREELSPSDHQNEYILTRLRTSDGIDRLAWQNQFGFDFWNSHAVYLQSLHENGYANYNDQELRLTNAGRRIFNSVITPLLVE